MTASPVAEEAARLVAALQDWFTNVAGPSDAAADGHAGRETAGTPGTPGTHGTHGHRDGAVHMPPPGAAECALCPWCRLLGMVRGLNPDVFEHLAGAAQEVVAALRVALETPASPDTARRSGLQHIDIGD